MEFQNILITGGCGFIGSNFINYFTKKYPDSNIYNVDCLNYCASEENVNPSSNYTFLFGNILDHRFLTYILEKYNIDCIVHFAAQSHVDNSFNDSLQYTMDNIVGTHTLLECSKKYGKLKLFLHFSTDEVYGEVDISHQGCSEYSLLNPTNPYSATKAGCEFLVRAYNHSFQIPFVIVRCNNVYGENQYEEKLIPRFIKLLLQNQKCTIQGNGETRRNFIHAYDVSTAVDTILIKKPFGEIINIGTSNEYSVMEIAKILVEKIKQDTHFKKYIEYVEDRPFNDFRYHIQSSKLKDLGWSEQIEFDDGINQVIQHYKNKWMN